MKTAAANVIASFAALICCAYIAPTIAAAPSTREQIARTQVWLLAKDGSVINPVSTQGKAAGTKIASLRYLGQTPHEVQYTFPISASDSAVAVAVMLDDKLYIDRLRPLK